MPVVFPVPAAIMRSGTTAEAPAVVTRTGCIAEMAPMYRAFRGKDPSVEPLLERRGLKRE
jgi:Zn-dependent oligopeptidase